MRIKRGKYWILFVSIFRLQKSNKSFRYEIIVVDDGSRDKTSQVALEYSKKHTTELIRVLTLAKNRGKGGAVRLVSNYSISCNFL